MDILFIKAPSIDRDLSITGSIYQVKHEYNGQNWHLESEQLKMHAEMINLGTKRTIDNILEIKKIELHYINEYDEKVGDLVRRYINFCSNAQRLLELKEDDDGKGPLILSASESIHKCHLEILSATRKLYSSNQAQ